MTKLKDLTSLVIIDDNNNVDDIANYHIADDIIGCVDGDMVHTKQHDLITLDVHVGSPLLHPNFGLLIGIMVDIDYSRVILQKLILDIWVEHLWSDRIIKISTNYHYVTCDY